MKYDDDNRVYIVVSAVIALVLAVSVVVGVLLGRDPVVIGVVEELSVRQGVVALACDPPRGENYRVWVPLRDLPAHPPGSPCPIGPEDAAATASRTAALPPLVVLSARGGWVSCGFDGVTARLVKLGEDVSAVALGSPCPID